MKTSLLSYLLVGLLLTTSVFLGSVTDGHPKHAPQGGAGIYATAADYQQHKLTVHTDCQNDRVRLNEFLDRSYITVLHEGKKHDYPKESIFGYRDCEGKDFRFFHRRLFEIEEVKSIVVYRQLKMESAEVGGKGVKMINHYYFSLGLDAPIMPLTKGALEHALPANDKLHDLLDAQFHSDHDEVSSYDSFHHMFKVNRLLQSSLYQ